MFVKFDMEKSLSAGLPLSERRAVDISLETAAVMLATDGSLEGSHWLPHMEPLS